MLDTKYEGAVTIDIWTRYAIMVVGKFKDRKVIAGPASYVSEFDEYLDVAKQYNIDFFYTNAYSIIKKTILGEDLKINYTFKENNVHIYDVDILNVKIVDDSIAKLMMGAQQVQIQQSTTINREKAKLEIIKAIENIRQETLIAEFETKNLLANLNKKEIEKKQEVELARIEMESKTQSLSLETQKKAEQEVSEITKIKLQREKEQEEQKLHFMIKDKNMHLSNITGEAKAIAEKTKAITPESIAALQAFANKHLLEKMAESMAPLAILDGESVADVFSRLLEGTKLESVFLNLNPESINLLPNKKNKDKKD